MPDAIPSTMRLLLRLRMTPGVGPRIASALFEHFGQIEKVFQASFNDLVQVDHVGPKVAQAIYDSRNSAAVVDAELQRAAQFNVRLIPWRSPEYPDALGHIPDPPLILYTRGTLTATDARAVGIVGTRNPTEYGRRMATRLGEGLARAGYTIVSGLARGIDGIAHRAALNGGGRTLAVLAGGLSRIYPPEHKELAVAVEQNGAILSESVMNQESLPALFPQRNRIISGLSRAVVIVEAAEKSGALITAEQAAEQGRSVLAVPGPADSEASGGCNALIRTGAVLCRSVEDVLEELQGVSTRSQALKGASPAPVAAPAVAPPNLDAGQLNIWEALAEGALHLDQLVQRLGRPVHQLTTELTMLEMRKVVKRLPGNRYERWS